jgi:hypothetical protein
MAFSGYLEGKLLDEVFSATAFTAPTNLYVALSTGLATAAVVEPSGNGYARVAVVNNATNWPAATGSAPASKSNGVAITFPVVTGTAQTWGTVQSFAIYDAVTAGNLICQGALTTSQTLNSGDTLSFAIAAMTITLS